MSDEQSVVIDTRKADAAYRSFPSFADWTRDATIDHTRWERYARLLQERSERTLTQELLTRAREVAKRAAAIDTGAIEGLYDVDGGFTFTVAMQMVTWEAHLDAKGARIRTMIEAQMGAYDFVLDFATQRVPIAEAWIRTLHEVMCRGQQTYSALTEVGWQEQVLPLGQYKAQPNHVLKRDGLVHSYAPVDLVPEEMNLLCAELRSAEFAAAHPVEQASYAHYAFVAVHPFADGNGRVARALASVFTYRALSVPLMVLAEHKNGYRSSLAEADAGNFQPFTDFMFDRAIDSIELVAETLKAVGGPHPLEAVARLRQIYSTGGGLTHADVDRAGYRLLEAFVSDMRRQAGSINVDELTVGFDLMSLHEDPNALPLPPQRREYLAELQSIASHRPRYRMPVTLAPQLAETRFSTLPPAKAELRRRITVFVPKNAGKEDEILLHCLETGETFESRVMDAHPVIAGALQLRLGVFVNALLGRAIDDLTKAMAAVWQRDQ